MKSIFIERSIKSALGFFKEAVFSDDIARTRGLLQSIGPRVKILSLIVMLVLILLVRTLPVMAVLYGVSVALAVLSGINLFFFIKRTWVFIPLFALFIAIPAFFTQGPYAAALFVMRVATCVSFAVLITVTTKHNDLLRSLRALGVSAMFVSVLDMTYRYIFLFIKVFEEMHIALKARLIRRMQGKTARHWIASRIGHIFRRSVRMSEEVYMAIPWSQKEMANKALYEISGVSYSYLGRFRALSGVNLKIGPGERVALLGANGSGKSTLLMALAGLVFPDEGRIGFEGIELSEKSLGEPDLQRSFRSRVGIVFQNSDVQLFNSNVRDELLFGLLQLGLSGQEAEARLKKYIDLMDISGLTERHPQNLSVGEKKRVAIASVLVMEPQVMLLDEPTAGLDPKTSRHLIDAISEFSKENRTIITATQDIHIVTEIADRVIVLGEDKSVVKDGSAETVLKDIQLLQQHNLVHAHAHRHKEAVHVHPHEHPSHDHTHTA